MDIVSLLSLQARSRRNALASARAMRRARMDVARTSLGTHPEPLRRRPDDSRIASQKGT